MLDLSDARWRKSSHSDHHGGECVEIANAKWRKSSRSNEHGGDCVEVAGAPWRKGSRSDHHGGACVEVAGVAPVVAVRDSKNPAGPKLLVDRPTFAALLHAVHAGTHDLT